MEKKSNPAMQEAGCAGIEHARGSVEEVSLDMLGLSSAMEKNMSTFETVSAGWIICVSFAGVSGTMSLTIANGGPPALLYGIILVLFFMGASAASLAELASVYPTAGGQYHWASILAPQRWRRGLSYTCGMINVFAWISLCSGFAAVISQFAMALIIFYEDDYTPQPWHGFLMYMGATLLITLYNMFLLKRTPWINTFAFFFTLSTFLVILVTCTARASSRQDSATVWSRFVSGSSGWSSDGVVFLIGLVSPNYMFSGLDGAIHLAEDCKNARTAVPKALISTVIIGFITTFPFIVALLYTTSDFESVLSTKTGVAVYEIFRQACSSDAAASAFVVLILVCGVFATTGAQQTASRLTWSFARDNALAGSRWISKIDARWGVPIVALAANAVPVLVIGCIGLGSTEAFNAFIGSGLILQQLTYAIPSALLMLQRRNSTVLPPDRYFRLRGLLGWAANLATVIFAVLVLIFYDFPVKLPVDKKNMNYTVVVIGGVAFAALLNWIFHARAKYHGPSLQE